MQPRLRAMRLRSCNEETGEIIHTNVVNVWESGVKPVFRVTLENGRSFKMSKDHRCLTQRRLAHRSSRPPRLRVGAGRRRVVAR